MRKRILFLALALLLAVEPNAHATIPTLITLLDGIRPPANFGVVANAAARGALVGMLAGDIVFETDNTTWYYYIAAWTTCAGHVPVTFPATATAGTLAAIVGMGLGDTVYELDIHVWYYYNGGAWVAIGIDDSRVMYTGYLPIMAAGLQEAPIHATFDPPLSGSQGNEIDIVLSAAASVYWNIQGTSGASG